MYRRLMSYLVFIAMISAYIFAILLALPIAIIKGAMAGILVIWEDIDD